MTPEDTIALAHRFLGAIERGDVETVRACYAPDAKIWHNNDGLEQDVEQNLKVLRWMMRALPSRTYRLLRLEPLPDGYLQQHVLEADLPDGTRWEMHACVVVRVEDGRIVRLDEYLDSAAAAAISHLGRR